MDRSWSVGNAPENDVVVDRQTVSGRHCRLTKMGGEFFVEDVGSTNGTYVNGAKISGAGPGDEGRRDHPRRRDPDAVAGGTGEDMDKNRDDRQGGG